MRIIYWLLWLTTGKCCSECGGGPATPRWGPWIEKGAETDDYGYVISRSYSRFRCSNKYHNMDTQ